MSFKIIISAKFFKHLTFISYFIQKSFKRVPFSPSLNLNSIIAIIKLENSQIFLNQNSER